MQEKRKNNLENREIALFYIGEILCGIDTVYIREINKITNITKVYPPSTFIRGVVNLRGEIVTMIDLHAKFGFEIIEDFSGMNNLVVRYRDENIGLLVDNVQDVIAAEPEHIAESPANIEGVTGSFFEGVYMLEKELVAILDIDEIVKK